jgi:hypothetical protein
MEMNEPSEEIERALIDNAKQPPGLFPLPWYQRMAPVVGVMISLVMASLAIGALLFNSVSERATQAQQTKEHFVKLDETILVGAIERSEIKKTQADQEKEFRKEREEQERVGADRHHCRQRVRQGRAGLSQVRLGKEGPADDLLSHDRQQAHLSAQ